MWKLNVEIKCGIGYHTITYSINIGSVKIFSVMEENHYFMRKLWSQKNVKWENVEESVKLYPHQITQSFHDGKKMTAWKCIENFWRKIVDICKMVEIMPSQVKYVIIFVFPIENVFYKC